MSIESWGPWAAFVFWLALMFFGPMVPGIRGLVGRRWIMFGCAVMAIASLAPTKVMEIAHSCSVAIPDALWTLALVIWEAIKAVWNHVQATS